MCVCARSHPFGSLPARSSFLPYFSPRASACRRGRRAPHLGCTTAAGPNPPPSPSPSPLPRPQRQRRHPRPRRRWSRGRSRGCSCCCSCPAHCSPRRRRRPGPSGGCGLGFCVVSFVWRKGGEWTDGVGRCAGRQKGRQNKTGFQPAPTEMVHLLDQRLQVIANPQRIQLSPQPHQAVVHAVQLRAQK